MNGQQYLLDTNTVSESRLRRANHGVTEFLVSVPNGSLHLSVLTLGELQKGVAQKYKKDADGARKLESWVNGLIAGFADRIISVDAEIAILGGEMAADRSRPVVDTLLAATAVARGLTLVTRNVTDMRGLKVKLLNPWK